MNQETVRTVLGGLVLVCTALLAVFALLNSVNYQNYSEKVAFGLRETQYENCNKSGNVLREQVRDEFVDLKRKVLIPVIGGFADTLPNGTQKTLLRDTVGVLHHRIKTIESRIPDANCLELYPPLPGQTYDEGTS